MGRFAEKFSKEHRDGLLSLVLDHGMSIDTAIIAAAEAAGEPWMSRSSAKGYVSRERKRRESMARHAAAARQPNASVREMVGGLIGILEAQVEDLQSAAADSANDVDLDRLGNVAKILVTVDRVARNHPEATGPASPEQASPLLALVDGASAA